MPAWQASRLCRLAFTPQRPRSCWVSAAGTDCTFHRAAVMSPSLRSNADGKHSGCSGMNLLASCEGLIAPLFIRSPSSHT
jgi:hypothetical protein